MAPVAAQPASAPEAEPAPAPAPAPEPAPAAPVVSIAPAKAAPAAAPAPDPLAGAIARKDGRVAIVIHPLGLLRWLKPDDAKEAISAGGRLATGVDVAIGDGAN